MKTTAIATSCMPLHDNPIQGLIGCSCGLLIGVVILCIFTIYTRKEAAAFEAKRRKAKKGYRYIRLR